MIKIQITIDDNTDLKINQKKIGADKTNDNKVPLVSDSNPAICMPRHRQIIEVNF